MIYKIYPQNPQMRLIKKIADIINEGGIIAYPTDTNYGIGCSIFKKKAVQKVYDIRNRHSSKPFSFLCADLKDISQYAKVTNKAYRIMHKLLPGPYTFILEATRIVPKMMASKRKTVGIRVPDNPICQALLQEIGNPIISTSARVGEEDVMVDPYDIEDQLGHCLQVIIDGGNQISEPSSIISLIDDIPEIIREGKGPLDYILN